MTLVELKNLPKKYFFAENPAESLETLKLNSEESWSILAQLTVELYVFQCYIQLQWNYFTSHRSLSLFLFLFFLMNLYFFIPLFFYLSFVYGRTFAMHSSCNATSLRRFYCCIVIARIGKRLSCGDHLSVVSRFILDSFSFLSTGEWIAVHLWTHVIAIIFWRFVQCNCFNVIPFHRDIIDWAFFFLDYRFLSLRIFDLIFYPSVGFFRDSFGTLGVLLTALWTWLFFGDLLSVSFSGGGRNLERFLKDVFLLFGFIFYCLYF